VEFAAATLAVAGTLVVTATRAFSGFAREFKLAFIDEPLAAATLPIAGTFVVAATRAFSGFAMRRVGAVHGDACCAFGEQVHAMVIERVGRIVGTVLGDEDRAIQPHARIARELLIRDNRRRSHRTGCRTPQQCTYQNS